jgi:hypothetical protein
VSRSAWLFIALAFATAPGQAAPKAGTPKAHTDMRQRGINAPAEKILRDLRRILHCKRENADTCQPLPEDSAFYNVSLIRKGGRVYTVEATSEYGDGRIPRPGVLPKVRRRAAALVQYLVPDWPGASNWTRQAIDRSVGKVCDAVIRHRDVTIMVSPWHPAGNDRDFLTFTITRSPDLKDIYENYYSCINGVETRP